jgi:imidazolonepropionase-like amidohydrolase
MIVPGYSLHRELRLLSAAGLSNMDVLRAATTIPARYLERTVDLGGITKGKQADLVLLRSNPLDDISNSDDVETVIANGRAFTRDRLDALLLEAEALVRGN